MHITNKITLIGLYFIIICIGYAFFYTQELSKIHTIIMPMVLAVWLNIDLLTKLRTNKLGLLIICILSFFETVSLQNVLIFRKKYFVILAKSLVYCIGIPYFTIYSDDDIHAEKRKAIFQHLVCFLLILNLACLDFNVKKEMIEKKENTVIKIENDSLLNTDNYTIENNINSLNTLINSNLELEDKVKVFNELILAEVNQLKMNCPLPTFKVVKMIYKMNIIGYYSLDDNSICLDFSFLKDEKDQFKIIYVLMHETYHWYQHNLVKMYNHMRRIDLKEYMDFSVDKLKKYKYEFDHYINADEDIDAYSKQKIELYANQFAYQKVIEYKRKVENYNKD